MQRLVAPVLVATALLATPTMWRPAVRGQAPSPPTVDSAAPSLRSQADFDALLDQPGWSGHSWSVLAVSLDRGDTLYARTPHLPLAPASNVKLLTTAAALFHLGPGFRYTTFLLTDGRVEGGVLNGDIYLYGTGDPTLGKRYQERPAAALRAFADRLGELGIHTLRGDIVGDGSYFAGPRTGRGWREGYLDAWYAPAAGALSVHENLVRLDIRPADAPGWRPAVEYVPGGRGIALVNLATSDGGARLEAGRAAFDGPIVINGAAAAASSHAVPVADPARFAAAVFRDVLADRGIRVLGRVRAVRHASASPVSGRGTFAAAEGDAPRVLAVHTSEPLIRILHTINHESHNFYAEQVLRTVGRVTTGEGSIRGGARAVRRMLDHAGADTRGLRIYDGCGLSPASRVPAAAFVALLDWIAGTPLNRLFRSTLPVAGHAPRFRRMGGTPAEGNLRAKTGTIRGVSALSGYVTAANGERIAFSIIGNGLPSTGQGKYIENRIGASLASFARAGDAVPATADPSAATPTAAPDSTAPPSR